MTSIRIGRRVALAGGVAALASPAVVRAQADPIKLATLTPLTTISTCTSEGAIVT